MPLADTDSERGLSVSKVSFTRLDLTRTLVNSCDIFPLSGPQMSILGRTKSYFLFLFRASNRLPYRHAVS